MASELLLSHRAPKVGEWNLTPPELHDVHQQLAAISNGILTLANVITLLGGYQVIKGINNLKNGDYIEGVVRIAIGRLCDILDGLAADRYKVKGPTGEKLDAGVDSALTVVAAYELRKLEIIPDAFAAALATEQVLSAIFTGLAFARKNEIHTGASGKISQGLKWPAVGLYTISHAAENTNKHELVNKLIDFNQADLAEEIQAIDLLQIAGTTKFLAHAFALGGISVGALADYSYAKQALS